MKRKSVKKSTAPAAEATLPATVSTPVSAEVPIPVSYPSSDGMFMEDMNGEMPSPHELLMEAEEEPNYYNLRAYVPVMGTLRRKGFSYREIAEWLGKRGVSVDHNAVYRVYRANMPDELLHEEDLREEQEEAEQH